MEIRFGDFSLDRLETDPRFDAGFSQSIVTAFRNRMQLIRAAPDERVFHHMKSLRFEKLTSQNNGQFSMRLNDFSQLVIELQGEAPNKVAVIVSIEDCY